MPVNQISPNMDVSLGIVVIPVVLVVTEFLLLVSTQWLSEDGGA